VTDLLERDRETGQVGEDEVAAILGRAWRCQVRPSPRFCPYDFELDRAGRMAAIVEVKTRRCSHDKYDETYITLEKWYRLFDLSRALDLPAFYVVNFTDEIRFIDATRIDPRKFETCGRTDRPYMRHDISTKILVPVTEMGRVAK
jgi:hypothetical protein